MADNENILLYKELLDMCQDIIKYIEKTKTFDSQLSITSLNKECYDKMYKVLPKVAPRQSFFEIIPGLEKECSSCWKFYLSPRNKSIRILDIQLGKKFQEKFIQFLNSKGIDCRRGDEKKKIYPDNVVFKEGKIKAYLEIKYQSAPWIFAFKQGRECYEGSPALDIKKLEQQYNLIKSGEITAPIYYVYWLDFPCIKGVFFISAEKMYEYYKNNAQLFDRKSREGDFEVKFGKKVKVAATTKIHPSLLMMDSFSNLIKKLK